MWPDPEVSEDLMATVDDDAPTGEDDEGPVDDGAQSFDESETDPHILQLIREIDDPVGYEKFERRRPPTLPQPARARSAPDLPMVKSSAFLRILR